MSSIYRKGRDGYFYYQTYVDNPKTGKRDKRIFHSLKTKERIEAEKKQIELDKKYTVLINNQKRRPFFGKEYFNAAKKLSFILTIFLIVIFLNNIKNMRSNITKIEDLPKEPKNQLSKETILKNISDGKENISSEKILDYSNDVINKSENSEKRSIDIPEYDIIRIDRLSGSFNQGKIYVTVNESTSDEVQHALCQEISKRFSEFSNIIICLYASNSAGLDLANGNYETITMQEQKRYWLAMYTFNSVEGEYFDNYPSGYLGNLQNN